MRVALVWGSAFIAAMLSLRPWFALVGDGGWGALTFFVWCGVFFGTAFVIEAVFHFGSVGYDRIMNKRLREHLDWKEQYDADRREFEERQKREMLAYMKNIPGGS